MMIRFCEGTDGPFGYRTLFGGGLFDDFSKHPNVRRQFLWGDGTVGYSTAAGAFQIIFPTWTGLQQKLRLPDFSPPSQDAAAIELISERRAMADVGAGRLQEAINKCWPIWASLPASQYSQPKRTMQFACNKFAGAGGVIA